MGFDSRFFWRDLNHGLEMAWSDPSHSSFRFPYDCLRGAHRAKRGSFFSFVHLESLERSIEKRMEALGEESLGAIFHGGCKEA
jgi:hypothetical protein